MLVNDLFLTSKDTKTECRFRLCFVLFNSNLSKPLLFFRLRTILTHSRPNRDIHCQSSTGSIVLFNDRQNNQRRHSFVPLTYEPKKLVKTSSRQFSSLLQQRRRPIHFIPPNIPPGSRGLGWVRKNYQFPMLLFDIHIFEKLKKVRMTSLASPFECWRCKI